MQYKIHGVEDAGQQLMGDLIGCPGIMQYMALKTQDSS
jgi:hypothetical protein